MGESSAATFSIQIKDESKNRSIKFLLKYPIQFSEKYLLFDWSGHDFVKFVEKDKEYFFSANQLNYYSGKHVDVKYNVRVRYDK